MRSALKRGKSASRERERERDDHRRVAHSEYVIDASIQPKPRSYDASKTSGMHNVRNEYEMDRFTSPRAREYACMCSRACLSGQSDTPRRWIIRVARRRIMGRKLLDGKLRTTKETAGIYTMFRIKRVVYEQRDISHVKDRVRERKRGRSTYGEVTFFLPKFNLTLFLSQFEKSRRISVIGA